MFSALWLIRFAALAVRANRDTLTSPATTTTATTTPFVRATAPRSLRHRARCCLWFLANFPPPCRKLMVPQAGGRRFPQWVDTGGDIRDGGRASAAAITLHPLRGWCCASVHRPGDGPEPTFFGSFGGPGPVVRFDNSVRVGPLVQR